MLAGQHHHHDLAVIIIADLPRSAGLLRLLASRLKQRQTGQQIVSERKITPIYIGLVIITLISSDSGVQFGLFYNIKKDHS